MWFYILFIQNHISLILKYPFQCEGPFKITEVLEPITYWLNLPISWQIHNVFHAILLKPYQENETYGENFSLPPPEIIDGEEVYQVETILWHWKRGRGYQYLVKWTGYPISEASWESESSFSDNGDTLTRYKQRNQLWNYQNDQNHSLICKINP